MQPGGERPLRRQIHAAHAATQRAEEFIVAQLAPPTLSSSFARYPSPPVPARPNTLSSAPENDPRARLLQHIYGSAQTRPSTGLREHESSDPASECSIG